MLTAAVILGILIMVVKQILFGIEAMLCKIVDILYDAFEMFAGISPVTYYGKSDYLINVLFSNKVVSVVYWGMAVIGFALVFGFSIASVVRKLFDHSGEKVKATYGMILLNAFKAILIILLLTAIVSATINGTGILMQQIDFLFDNAEDMANPSRIVFGDDDFATMFRIMDTIGNYSLNPSYDNRFNVNACFNDIRYDMQSLDKIGAFNFSYIDPSQGRSASGGAAGDAAHVDPNSLINVQNNSWQAALLKIYTAHDIYEDIPIDEYNVSLSEAILDCMHQIKTNKEFKPLKEYSESVITENFGTTLGRSIMLACSFNSAKNPKYNENPSMTDGLRRPYYVGDPGHNVYSFDDMDEDFDLGLTQWNHVVALLVSIVVIIEMAKILINATARIFNIIVLYLTAPGFVAVMPLDDGGKFKQWITAFVIQSLSIIGSLFAVRLIMVFIPIILNPNLVLFESAIGNMFAKLAFIVGVCITASKASGMISGILADNAGYQSIMAGQVADGFVAKAQALTGRALAGAAKLGLKAGGAALSGLGHATGVSQKMDKMGEGIKNFGQSIADKNLVGAAKSGFTTKKQDDDKAKGQKEEADKRDTQDFRSGVMSYLGKMAGGSSSGGSGSGQGGSSSGSDSQPVNNNHQGGSEGEGNSGEGGSMFGGDEQQGGDNPQNMNNPLGGGQNDNNVPGEGNFGGQGEGGGQQPINNNNQQHNSDNNQQNKQQDNKQEQQPINNSGPNMQQSMPMGGSSNKKNEPYGNIKPQKPKAANPPVKNSFKRSNTFSGSSKESSFNNFNNNKN